METGKISRGGLPEKYITQILEVSARCPTIQSVILFGSRAKGNYKRGSDIDLAVRGHNITHHDILVFRSALDDLSSPYMYDVVLDDEHLEKPLKEHIARVGVVLK